RATTAQALHRAPAVALAETGGGRVTGSEIHDEESYYEVEVTRDDGSQVDVQLDENFAIVGSTTDKGGSGESGRRAPIRRRPGPGGGAVPERLRRHLVRRNGRAHL